MHNQFNNLLKHSIEENDIFLYQMLQEYMHNPRDWSQFLVELVLGFSALNKTNQQQLIKMLEERPPPVYIGSIHEDG